MEINNLPVGQDRIQDGCQKDPHGTLFRHFNIYNFLLDNICFQKKLVSLNIPGGAREAPLSTRLYRISGSEEKPVETYFLRNFLNVGGNPKACEQHETASAPRLPGS